MNAKEINVIVSKQHAFFESGATRSVKGRIQVMKRMKRIINEYETELFTALKTDLGKSRMESFMCEIGLAQEELTYMIKHVNSFARNKRVRTPLAQFSSRSYVKSSPYGTVLIVSPWNYPFLLTIDPMIDAIAAGNTVVLKPSAYSPATSEVIAKMIAECFDPAYVTTVNGGRDANKALFEEKWDYIFFTGSQNVGREVLRHAAEYLTPCTLELGGKSPCIVDRTADIELAAKRIVFGKYLNCGQTCIAPDYVYCDATIKDSFVAAVKKEIVRQYGEQPLQNEDYGKIINAKHWERIVGLMSAEADGKSKVVYGGQRDLASLRIEPTVMDGITWDDSVMKEEIFGPLMPILTYHSLDEVMVNVRSHAKPLALYFFSKDKGAIRNVMTTCQFGGGCVNDVIIHLATTQMGFGGVGESGMGAYHGKTGFDTFSHKKSIVDKHCFIDLPMRYQPYKKMNEWLLHKFLK